MFDLSSQIMKKKRMFKNYHRKKVYKQVKNAKKPFGKTHNINSLAIFSTKQNRFPKRYDKSNDGIRFQP